MQATITNSFVYYFIAVDTMSIDPKIRPRIPLYIIKNQLKLILPIREKEIFVSHSTADFIVNFYTDNL